LEPLRVWIGFTTGVKATPLEYELAPAFLISAQPFGQGNRGSEGSFRRPCPPRRSARCRSDETPRRVGHACTDALRRLERSCRFCPRQSALAAGVRGSTLGSVGRLPDCFGSHKRYPSGCQHCLADLVAPGRGSSCPASCDSNPRHRRCTETWSS